MPTAAECREAEIMARQQRKRAQVLLRIDNGKASERAQKVHQRACAADDFDKVLADPEVNKLFMAGVLRFGEQNADPA